MTDTVADARAKLNLFLAVREARPDGYHELDMVNVEAGLSDRLTFCDRIVPGIQMRCNNRRIPLDERNLVWKAVSLLLGDRPNPGIRIEIDKRIPVGAGLGGGSSNAAITLRVLNETRSLGRDRDLPELAAQIGSDVPYSLIGGLCRCRGRGEQVERIDVAQSSEPWLHVLLILPNVAVRTAYAYRWLDECGIQDECRPSALLDAIERRNIGEIRDNLHNSFDPVVSEWVPQIRHITAATKTLFGLEPHLSGSGSAMFLLSDQAGELSEIRDRLRDGLHWPPCRFEIAPLTL
jgi:4-diphosphocytidyl-2-C-methyl-D-erythritol kinase